MKDLPPEAGVRRFLIHVLPRDFDRIRHFGLFANTSRAANLARARALLACATAPPTPMAANDDDGPDAFPCPCCGGHMRLIEVFERGAQLRASFTPKVVGIDSS